MTSTQAKCSANITTNRSRVKVYQKGDNVVYLKDGQKFEIELFNPHNFKILAKIKFNGHYISQSGIVLKPGQRVFLERYLDSNNAFVFSTYEIDGTVEALKAISENGNISVEFYAEYIQTATTTWITTTADWTYRPGQIHYTNDFYIPSSGTIASSGSVNCLYSSNINEAVKGSMETGRVEKGGTTQQTFETDNSTFSSFAYESVYIKMLPTSAKPVEVSEIRNYCTGCGTRVKKASWKYCPSCGEKI